MAYTLTIKNEKIECSDIGDENGNIIFYNARTKEIVGFSFDTFLPFGEEVTARVNDGRPINITVPPKGFGHYDILGYFFGNLSSFKAKEASLRLDDRGTDPCLDVYVVQLTAGNVSRFIIVNEWGGILTKWDTVRDSLNPALLLNSGLKNIKQYISEFKDRFSQDKEKVIVKIEPCNIRFRRFNNLYLIHHIAKHENNLTTWTFNRCEKIKKRFLDADSSLEIQFEEIDTYKRNALLIHGNVFVNKVLAYKDRSSAMIVNLNDNSLEYVPLDADLGIGREIKKTIKVDSDMSVTELLKTEMAINKILDCVELNFEVLVAKDHFGRYERLKITTSDGDRVLQKLRENRSLIKELLSEKGFFSVLNARLKMKFGKGE